MGKYPYFPHGSSSTAASSRMGKGTPDPFLYLGWLPHIYTPLGCAWQKAMTSTARGEGM
jgi:hypothetical protein